MLTVPRDASKIGLCPLIHRCLERCGDHLTTHETRQFLYRQTIHRELSSITRGMYITNSIPVTNYQYSTKNYTKLPIKNGGEI